MSRQWPPQTTVLSVLSHAFVNVSTKDAAAISLGKLCVCQIAGMFFFSSYSLHDVCQEMQKKINSKAMLIAWKLVRILPIPHKSQKILCSFL